MSECRAAPFRSLAVRYALAVTACAAFQGMGSAGASAATTANKCYVATGAAAHVLCWLDLTGYAGTGTAAYSWTLPDGSVLSGNLQNASASSVGAPSALPTYGGAELGTNVYTGVGGEPAVYGGTADSAIPLTIANLSFANTAGTVAPTFVMVGADAETVDSGDTTGKGYVDWSTTGRPWSVLQHPTVYDQGCTIAIGGALGAGNAQCLAATNGPTSDIYVLSSVVATNQSIAMSESSTAKNGYALAIEVASIDVSKTLTARVATTDQFTVRTRLGTKVAYSASTAGTGTAATTGIGAVAPGAAYTIDETASNDDLGSYATSIACTNADAASTTVLPSGKGTSFAVTPAVDDQISCTFTNAPFATLTKTVTNETKANGTPQADTGVPKDDLRYGLTFTNATGVAITGTTAKPIVVSDTVPAKTIYVKSACPSPQNGLTCTIAAPAVGSTGTTITFSFVGILAAGQTLTGSFDVTIM